MLSLCRRGRLAEALALQEGFEDGLLGKVRARAVFRLESVDPAAAVPIHACGDYEPRGRGRRGGGAVLPGFGRPYGEAILRLKSWRTRERFLADPGSEELRDALAGRLARALRGLGRGGLLGRGPVLVVPVPGARPGPPAFGLCHVTERACALAGRKFRFRILLLRALEVPRSHLGAGARGAGGHLRSLLPLRDPEARGAAAAVLVDDVASSGATLSAAASLLEGFNRVPALGLALARTRAVHGDRVRAPSFPRPPGPGPGASRPPDESL